MALAGYTVALSGTFPGSTHTALQSTITGLGASFARSVTAATNFLVSTPADVVKASKKVQDAEASGIPIVSIDWLYEAEQSSTTPAPDDFQLNTKAAPTTDTNSKGKKRVSDDVSTAPNSKVPKTGMLDVVPKLEPKVGDGSVLRSRNVNIALDEGCPLQTYRVYINENGIVYDASLNKTDASANNNKFYRVQVLNSSDHFESKVTDSASCFGIQPRMTTKPGRAGVE